jgi:hypothetical protein
MCQPHSSASAIEMAHAAPDPTCAAAAGRRAPSARLKLWQLPRKYHCPVIGSCLHAAELRALARRSGALLEHGRSDYEVHVNFVAAAEDRNVLSVAAQKALDRKYAAALRRFARARSAPELKDLWQAHVADGRIPEAFWALMTHPQADPPLRTLAYEEVHMLSHQIGAGLAADVHALGESRAELERLRREQAATAARHAAALAERDRRIATLAARVADLADSERELQAARARIHDLEAGNALRGLWEQLGKLEAAHNAEAEQRRSLEAETNRLRAALAGAHAEQHRLAAALVEREAACGALELLLEDPAACPGEDCDDCPRAAHCVDLGGRRILCVGGRGSLARHYRDLVQRCNGELIRHDGGLEESRQRLESLLASADAVVCPADAVSHDAYLRTKRFCKRADKPCVLLERSGIGAFARALADLAVNIGPPTIEAAPAEVH